MSILDPFGESPAVSIQRTRHRAQSTREATKLTLPCEMNMTLETFFFYLDTEKGCNSEDACRCANELVHELTESKKRSGRQSAAPS